MTENYISDTCLRGETIGRVKDLAGFNRFNREPEDHSPNTQRYIHLAGSQEVAARAESLFASIRTSFRYKRKEIRLACDGGGASISTPDFEVTVMLEQDVKVAANYRLSVEVGKFRRPDLVSAPHFVGTFAAHCDQVAISFAKPVDIEEKIDRIEENDELAQLLDYDAACSWFVLRLPQLMVEVTSLQMVCRLPGQADLSELIAQTQLALARLSSAGVRWAGP